MVLQCHCEPKLHDPKSQSHNNMDKQLGSNLTDVTLSPVNSTLNENDVRDYDIVNNAPPSGGRSEEGDGPSVE